MSEHIFDELPAILRGESDRSQLEAAANHLRRCADCQHELISALVAHASLMSASRLNSTGAAFRTDEQAPALSSDSEPLPLDDVDDDGQDLPDLSDLFAQVRAEAAAEQGRPTAGVPGGRKHRSARTRWLVAAAAIVALGVGGGSYAVLREQTPAASVTTVALAAYDQGHAAAAAKVAGGDMRVDATALPKPEDGKLYEVWLTNSARTRMHSLGWIDPNGKGDFTVPAPLMNEYSAIEVSVQDLSSSYDYSGISVLRGTY